MTFSTNQIAKVIILRQKSTTPNPKLTTNSITIKKELPTKKNCQMIYLTMDFFCCHFECIT